MSDHEHDTDHELGSGTIEKSRTKEPSLYRVLIHNDDYTTMEFVVHVLEKFFKKSKPEASAIMLAVHTQGVGVCGLYTYEVAETKTHQVNQYARKNGHPLRCSFETE